MIQLIDESHMTIRGIDRYVSIDRTYYDCEITLLVKRKRKTLDDNDNVNHDEKKDDDERGRKRIINYCHEKYTRARATNLAHARPCVLVVE